MKIDIRDIYEQIGNLFYAVAIEQGITPIQVAELKLVISNGWLPRYNDANEYFPTPAGHTILITLDALQAVKMPAHEAYGRFAQFYILHTPMFTHELQLHIAETVAEILRVFPSLQPNQFASAMQDLFRPVSA